MKYCLFFSFIIFWAWAEPRGIWAFSIWGYCAEDPSPELFVSWKDACL